MKKGEILVYCGNTNLFYTKNKKYIIKNERYYEASTFRKVYTFCITGDLGKDYWYGILDLKICNFKLEKDLRKDKLKKLNETG